VKTPEYATLKECGEILIISSGMGRK